MCVTVIKYCIYIFKYYYLFILQYLHLTKLQEKEREKQAKQLMRTAKRNNTHSAFAKYIIHSPKLN